ncbi:hypothetical protein RHMOL_Rhmol10G0212600 [Rhododendron molle]|uniref:Uncharacterized protein n=1 Tax=Rhododendron molle TaxID=49168 RepID=A0ACC0M4M1_RHOML|nr:hypothetical protein RHMOL_Rhmol10G0212600 [Rhododendron molle]
MYLKLLPHQPTTAAAEAAVISHLDLPQPVRGQPKGQLMAPPLVLEPVDAPQGLGDGHVEDQVGQGEEANGDPAVAALEAAGGLGLGEEDEAQEEEEELEELPELLLLEVHGPLLLQGLLEVELDYVVQGLEGRFFGDRVVVVGRV